MLAYGESIGLGKKPFAKDGHTYSVLAGVGNRTKTNQPKVLGEVFQRFVIIVSIAI